jgi:diguanylate cyclase (GGDEF)-like protein
MTQQFYAILSLLLSLAVCGVLSTVYARKRDKSLTPWLAIWILLSIHFCFLLLLNFTGESWAWALTRWSSTLAALGLVHAAREYSGRPRRWGLLVAIASVSLLWTVYHAVVWLKVLGENRGPFWINAVASIWACGSFWQCRRLRGSLAVRLLALVCLGWAVLNVIPVALSHTLLEKVLPIFFTISLLNLLMVAIGIVILTFEGLLQRVEDNMMSFSLLNLASIAQQDEAGIPRMLERVLDRVLSVYAIDRGLIVVNPGEREPSTRVFRGWPAGFAEEWRRRSLEQRLSDAVARVGGMLAVPDLEDPGALAMLDPPKLEAGSSDGAPALGEILRSAGANSLLAVSLRTPKRVYGAMLLAPRTWLSYNSAELRLLTSLGIQVGMGLDNFLLMKGAARRTEELHLLNQTGRAISSTLEADSLLRRIHEELQKLMDASNFYVAMSDDTNGEIRFELETENGRYLPHRSRKSLHGLTEHLLETAQPLLIRSSKHLDEYRAEHGIQSSGRQALSWLGAPVVIRGRAAGVMAVQSYDRENAYDEDHLEVLRIVAAQAAVALENARLFAGEQERLRHLTFLHNVTRIAISTLNAGEVMSQIVREIHSSFGYDHIGIGLLDYETKTVEWRAAAGLAPERVLGRRVSLESSLISRVARGGEAVLLEDASRETVLSISYAGAEGSRFGGVLPESRSVACLPIVYADQLLGVLDIECEKPGLLRPDHLPLLRTMAAHLATALHNAFTFQLTKEQAITDGLTGVKTHRYFMEALNGEWKRAMRSGRIFSLLVLDLDRFKQVNDTLGHLEGDLVLVRLGRILEERCRKSNVVARYGGDEFMVLMPETTTEQAHKLADRLRLWIATDPMFMERQLTASFGLSTYPIHGHTPEEIIRVADAGLYIAKHQGGNHVAVAQQYRQSQNDQWRTGIFAELLQELGPGVVAQRTRHDEAPGANVTVEPLVPEQLGPTGPEIMEKWIQRLEEAWGASGMEVKDLARSMESGLGELADRMELRVHGLPGHHEQVTRYAMLLAGSLGLTEAQLQNVRVAARLHDVGFLAVPHEVLRSREKLTVQEFAAIHVHAGAGARLLQAARVAPEICEMVRHHHEFVNGRGYPDGLPGERIPLGARILAISDAYDAITGDRPYRSARDLAEALEEMERFAGTQFDELLVRTFVRVMRAEAGQEVTG